MTQQFKTYVTTRTIRTSDGCEVFNRVRVYHKDAHDVCCDTVDELMSVWEQSETCFNFEKGNSFWFTNDLGDRTTVYLETFGPNAQEREGRFVL